MPELPEVEAVARGLRASLVGRTFADVSVLWERSTIPPDAASFARRLAGRQVAGVERRGKWLVIALAGGDSLLVHLRMTGRLQIEAAHCPESRHLRVLFVLDDGRRLSFIDPRKFGRLRIVADAAEALRDLGPEPLADDFCAERLHQMLAARRGRIKPLLMDQRFLAGLGNIYADEALWRARIHPLHRADTLTAADAGRLHEAIRSVLREAITGGGTTLRDATYRQTDGQPGTFARSLAAYGKEGQPCRRCGTVIERIRISQRSAHFCPRCQPPPQDQ
jgi:formamidopyrimidine-DNA glycosylase